MICPQFNFKKMLKGQRGFGKFERLLLGILDSKQILECFRIFKSLECYILKFDSQDRFLSFAKILKHIFLF